MNNLTIDLAQAGGSAVDLNAVDWTSIQQYRQTKDLV